MGPQGSRVSLACRWLAENSMLICFMDHKFLTNGHAVIKRR